MPNKLTKETKSYGKTRGDHYKDLVIVILATILVTAITAFVAGVKVANSQHAQVARAVNAATTVKK